jgi:hypothetical protein
MTDTRPRRSSLFLASVLLVHCGSDGPAAPDTADASPGGAATSGGASSKSSGGTSSAGGASSGGTSAGGNGSGGDAPGSGGARGDAGPTAECEAFAHFGEATNTFTLPAGKETISYPDVQKSFPDVDWQTLDRLYVPAGEYKTFQIGNLPVRDASRPGASAAI